MTHLVVINDADSCEPLLREAARLSAGTGEKLAILSFVSEDEYKHNLETVREIGQAENVTYDENSVLDGIKNDLSDLANNVFGGQDIEFDVSVEVVNKRGRSKRLIEFAETRGCNHVFLSGARRSPAGKAVFGNIVQSVILNFDGFVTTNMN